MKEGPGLLDTGPLISFLASGLRHHSWTCEQWKFFRPPLLTCEPVLNRYSFSQMFRNSMSEAAPAGMTSDSLPRVALCPATIV